MVDPKRIDDEAFGNLSRLLAGEALLRLEEMRAELKHAAQVLMTESTESELRYALETEQARNLEHGETIARLREDNADLLKRLTLLSKS